MVSLRLTLRGLAVLVAAVGLAGTLFAMPANASASSIRPTGQSEAVAQAAPNGYPVYECFRTTGPLRFKAKTFTLTTTNFGNTTVTAYMPIELCEQALKVRPGVAPPMSPPALPTPLLQCFLVRSTDAVGQAYVLTTNNFGPQEVVVGTPTMMCEGATKQFQSAAGGFGPKFGSLDPATVWQCFNIRTPATVSGIGFLTTQNFGTDAVYFLRPALLCESARKTTTAGTVFGTADGQVFECFAIEATTNLLRISLLTTNNFGSGVSLIRRGNLMCEPAVKDRK